MKRFLIPIVVLLVAGAAVAVYFLTRPAPVTEVVVWSWDVAATGLQQQVASFEADPANANIKIRVEDLGNQQVYDQGIAGCVAGGAGMPDVYSVENNEAEVFWARFPECFADLAPLGAAALRADFPEFKWAELTVGDRIHAIPWDSGPVVYFYRRDMFEQASVDPAQIATWGDLITAGNLVKTEVGTNVRMGTINKGGDDEWFRMLANQADCFYFDDAGREVTVNQGGCVIALQTIKSLWDAQVLAPGDWTGQIQLIKNDAVAGALFGAWYAGTLQNEAPEQSGQWGVIRVPSLTQGGVRAANLGGSALAIPASSEKKEAAFAFIRHALATTPGQIRMLECCGLVPSYLPATRAPEASAPVAYFGGQPIWELVLSTLGDVPPVRGSQHFQVAREIMVAIVSDYLDGNFESAQQALNEAATRISAATTLPVAMDLPAGDDSGDAESGENSRN